MLDTRPALIVAVLLGLLLGTFLHAAVVSIEVHGKLLADENSAEDGHYVLENENNDAVCAQPGSQLNDWLTGSIGHRVTVRIEAVP